MPTNSRKKTKTKTTKPRILRDNDHWRGYFEREEQEPYKITGKYLFFSPHREKLVKIAKHEIQNDDFYSAKIPLQGNNLGEDYVLCLYYKDDSKKELLAEKYRKLEKEGIKYRYWKSDEATLSGDYSKQFLGKLSRDDQKIFKKKKK
jgi:hypothetical protein